MKNFSLLLVVPFLILIFAASPFNSNFSTLPSYLPILGAIAISAIFIYLSYKRPIAGSQFVTILFLAGLLLRVAYLSDTQHFLRSYDVPGHISYIEYISTHHSLPSANDCWECYHPPLYYIIASPVCNFTSCQGNSLILLQLISLLFNIGFLFFGIKLLRLCFPDGKDDKYFSIASALLIFWPGGIINSIIINNDALLCFFVAGGLYFIAKWFSKGQPKNILLALGFLAASLLTKSNGIILLAIICFAALLRFIFHKNKKEALYSGLGILLLVAVFASLFAFGPMKNYKTANLKNMLVANAYQLGGQLIVNNKINDYVVFDAKEFLTVPYTDPWKDTGGRQYFFNYLLKTSMFGEFTFWQGFFAKQAILLSYLMIFIALILVAGMLFLLFDFFKYFRGVPKKISPLLLLSPIILFFVSALIFLRYLYPYACSGDFRYIHPIIIPISAVIIYAIYVLDKPSQKLTTNKKLSNRLLVFSQQLKPALALFCEAVVCIFIVASICFFASVAIL